MPMTVNTSWLREYLPAGVTHADLLDALPRIGLEIEEEHDLSKELAAVKVGFVRDKQPLAGAAGMYLCQIEMAKGRTIPVVCASEHEVKVGWGVPVAEAGVDLPTGKPIRETTVHGQRSAGMICLDGEMGMVASGSGMRYTEDAAALGQPVTSLSKVEEHLVVLNVLPNRPDFLGLIGIARDVAALLGVELQYPEVAAPVVGPPIPFGVEIAEPDLCTRYMGGLVKGVKVGPSPAWLKAKLLLAGMRPINNVVDVTNFVLYEWGQPLHAFDAAKLKGNKIVVRRMNAGESLDVLTGKIVKAEGQDGGKRFAKPPLVIADAERPVALAGVMGGASTQTTVETSDVFVEAAHFDPVNIRKTAREVDLGMESRGTASSYRFERGTDPNGMLQGALNRALYLLGQSGFGGKIAGPTIDVRAKTIEPRTIKLSAARTSSYLGREVKPDEIKTCLSRLKMDVSDDLTVRVPTWRVDANDPVVLIEDVARLTGYDRIPTAPTPTAPTMGGRSVTDRLQQIVSNDLVAAGFFETRTPPLELPDAANWLAAAPGNITVTNPMMRDMSVLRRTLVTGLAKVVDTNLRRGGATSVRFFEVDRTFDAAGPTGLPGRWQVAAIAGGQLHRSSWRAASAQLDFYALKGVVEDVLDAVKARRREFRPTDAGPFVPGTGAEIVLDGGKVAGTIGELDSAKVVVDRLPFKLFAFELSLDALAEPFAALPAYHPLARQPAVTRDIAIVVPVTTAYADIAANIRTTAGPTLESVDLVDRYQGGQIPAGRHSLAFHLVFRDATRTLTADEVADTMAKVTAALTDKFGAALRA